MKQSQLRVLVFLLVGVSACRIMVTPSVAPGDFDPVAQVNPHGSPGRYDHDQKFDVGVALYRTQTFAGSTPDQNYQPEARMAFQIRNQASQVDTASVNGAILPWISATENSGAWNTYTLHDPSTWGSVDSMTFTYRGFDSASFASTVEIAPSFGKIVHPDTLSAAQGCVFTYDNPVQGDSILVVVWTGSSTLTFSAQDNGMIVFAPHQLPYDATIAANGYEIGLSRFHWCVRTSSAGKRIGIYSEQRTEPGTYFPAKP